MGADIGEAAATAGVSRAATRNAPAGPSPFRVEAPALPRGKFADPQWTATGERRASVYRDPGRGRSLAVVVELRRLSTPILGWPRWTEPRGDAASERVLAAALREALQDPERIGFTP